MKRVLILILAVSPCAFAQSSGNAVFFQSAGAASGAVFTARNVSAPPVLGAPYSATITTEMVQTLADGTRIVLASTGAVARDSQGRTRQDAPLPSIAPANLPHIAFIQDPVAQTSYTLNLTDKTAQKMPPAPTAVPVSAASTFAGPVVTAGPIAAAPANAFFLVNQAGPAAQVEGLAALPALLPPPMAIAAGPLEDPGATTTQDLGSQTMEGVFVTGTRTTRTIPAGQIGNDRPISIVSEVWTSPDLKTIVYSKRDDPRLGQQTFQLTGISRAEPDPSLFTVPADFRLSDAPQPTVLYRQKQ